MRVLYIDRNYNAKDWVWKLKHLIKPAAFHGQSGFFLSALHSVFDMEIKNFRYLEKNIKNIHHIYDALIIDYKCLSGVKNKFKYFKILKKNQHIPKINFFGLAQANLVPKKAYFDLYDLVYKRECFIDLDRYDLREQDKLKLRTTMLCCPIVSVNKKNIHDVELSKLYREYHSAKYKYDAFFARAATNPRQVDVLEKLSDLDINFLGGVQRKKDKDWQKKYYDKRYSVIQYIDLIRKTKVNLALEGYGQFTYRHLELWYLGAFMFFASSVGSVSQPNYFVDISNSIDKKMLVLNAYSEKMRTFPHSHSMESVKALAFFRGTSIGFLATESFVVDRSLLRQAAIIFCKIMV